MAIYCHCIGKREYQSVIKLLKDSIPFAKKAQQHINIITQRKKIDDKMAAEIQVARLNLSSIKPTKEDERNLNSLLSRVRDINYLRPDMDPKDSWRLFYGKTWVSAREAARRAAFADGRYTEIDAETQAIGSPLSAIKTDLERSTIWSIARSAGYKAGMNLAMRASPESSTYSNWPPAFDVASVISLMAGMEMVKNVNFPGKDVHLNYVNEAFNILGKGYVVAYSFNGVSYVYCKCTKQSPSGFSLRT